MNIIGFLSHTIHVCAEGGNPELLLNRISMYGITPKEVVGIKTGIIFSMPARHYRAIHNLRKGTGCRVYLTRKAGPLFLFKRVYRRWSLIPAAALFFLTLYLLTCMVWRIDTGALSRENSLAIKALLFSEGIYPGCVADSDHLRLVEQNILTKSDTFSYLKLNFIGGRLEVSAKTPELHYVVQEYDGRLVAAFDGIISSVQVYKGYNMVKVNQSVAKGQLLVDNVSLNIDNEIVLSPVQAQIIGYGEAYYTHTEPLEITTQLLTNDSKSFYAIRFLSFRVPIGFSGNFDNNYHRQTSIEPLTVLGFKLPMTIEKTQLTRTRYAQIELTAEEAALKADRRIERQLYEDYDDLTVLSKKISYEVRDMDVITNVEYTFLANIIKIE